MIPKHIRDIADELDCELQHDAADLDEIIVWLKGVAIGNRTDELINIEEKYARILECLQGDAAGDDADYGGTDRDTQT